MRDTLLNQAHRTIAKYVRRTRPRVTPVVAGRAYYISAWFGDEDAARIVAYADTRELSLAEALRRLVSAGLKDIQP